MGLSQLPRGARLTFIPQHSSDAARARALLRVLPALQGRPIQLFRAEGLREGGRLVHAGSFLPQRAIAFNCPRREFPRVLVHELFHFAWFRLGNPRRLSYESLLHREHDAGARGELGWSAEWRKRELTGKDIRTRSRLWREYCCESFCDTAASIYSGVPDHEEFTLARRYRERRETWFARVAAEGFRL